MDLDRKSGRYLVLQREAESNRSVYQSLLQQEKELRVVSNSRANNVQLMDRAEIPGAPFSPNARRDWFTALLAGLLAAVGLVFCMEYLDDTVKNARGRVEAIEPGAPRHRAHRPRVTGSAAVGAGAPEFGEAFRSLRTSLVFTSTTHGPRVVAVTSASRSRARRRPPATWLWRWRIGGIARAARGCRHAPARPPQVARRRERAGTVTSPGGTGALCADVIQRDDASRTCS